MSDRHVIIGAGPVGLRDRRRLLADRGAEVVLVSRSGAGVDVPGVRTAVDAADPEGSPGLAEGAVALYNCVNPPSYDVWPEYWPPIAAALLAAAERTGAVLVTAGNLYPYGPVRRRDARGPARRGHRQRRHGLRAKMTRDAFALHDAGRIRAVEVRGSDYMGAPMGDNGPRPARDPAGPAGQGPSASSAAPHAAALVHRRPRHGPRARRWSPPRSRPGDGSGTRRPTRHAPRPRRSTTCLPALVASPVKVRALPRRGCSACAGAVRAGAARAARDRVPVHRAVRPGILEPSPRRSGSRRRRGTRSAGEPPPSPG